LPGCGFGAWDGYVVFLCEGTHTAGLSAHSHAATSGTGRVTTGGEGSGNFCGGSSAQPSVKHYEFDLQAPVTRIVNGDGTCTFRGADNATITGGQNTVSGDLTGTVVSTTPGESVTLRCTVRVDGVEVAATPTGVGTGAATASGQATFTADEGSTIEICAEGTKGAEPFTECVPATTSQVPPQEVPDLIEQIIQTVEDHLP
jgi:hypothetical protein